MPNIITRYLVREIVKSSAATILILFVILMSNALGRVLSDIADGDVPRQALYPVMLSQSVNLLSLLLPVGFFLGIIFAFGRLYKDHEIVVMNACGMGYRQFYRPVILVLMPLFLFSAYSNLWLNAQMQRNAQNIIEREENIHDFDQVKAGRFNQNDSGEQVFYMESISDDRLELHNIVLGQSGGEQLVIETAETGRNRVDEETGDLFLVVGPGQKYEGTPGSRDYKIISFEQHGILVEKKNSQRVRTIDVEGKTPQQLWDSTLSKDRTELHWRIAVPIVMVVLSLLALPLSYIAPRQGRFGKVGYAILVYLVYLNLMGFTRAKLEADAIPMAINFWWIHILFMGLVATLLFRRGAFGWLSGRRLDR